MGATLGGQVFGNWYDVATWAAFSAAFFYWAYMVPSLSIQLRERLPSFMRSKIACLIIGSLMAVVSIGKALQWW